MNRSIFAIVALACIGCATTNGEAYKLPACPPGVTYDVHLDLEGAHNVQVHSGRATLTGNVSCDGGPAQTALVTEHEDGRMTVLLPNGETWEIAGPVTVANSDDALR
jgi:hypothetical protein